MEDIKKAVPQDVDTTKTTTPIIPDNNHLGNLTALQLKLENMIIDSVMKLDGKNVGKSEGYLRGLAASRKAVIDRIKFLQAIAK